MATQALGRVFRDPVHGLIELPDRHRQLIENIIATRAFQRLRRIRQDGFASLVYPGAEHSRFGHALGAFHIATRVAAQLQLQAPLDLHVTIAALLHDVGHGPFSHAWEQAFPTSCHERWGARLVREDADLHGALASFDPELPEALSAFWDGSYQPRFARKLVSSQLDVDRLDYLLRDSHYSGAGYAAFDLHWIMHAMRVEAIPGDDGSDGNADDDSRDLVIDYRRGKYAVEQYLFARSYMYGQVYHHKTVRAAEWMFVKLMQRFGDLARDGREPGHLPTLADEIRGHVMSTDDYLGLDDFGIVSAMDAWAGVGRGVPHEDKVLADLARRLSRRELFKTIELGDDPAVVETLLPKLRAAAEVQFGDDADTYVHIDNAQQVGYSVDPDQELYVVGHPRLGTVQMSELLKAQPLLQPTSTVRVICAPELVAELQSVVASAI